MAAGSERLVIADYMPICYKRKGATPKGALIQRYLPGNTGCAKYK